MGATLLVELFVEELPPKALRKLGEAFAQGLIDGLRAQGLATADSVVTGYASPRRLGAQVSAVLPRAADKAQSVKLMPASVGLAADGQPTPALLKKLASLGADASVLPALKRQMDGKVEALFFDSVVPGATLAAGLQRALDEALAKLPIPKLMTYQPSSGALPGWSNVQFVRPAHGLVALHGDEVVPVAVLGLMAGRTTHGHRFEAAVDPVVIEHAERYAAQLREQGAVIASFAERRDDIARQLQHAAAGEGLSPIDDDALLDEVTALVERPKVLLGRFDESFLDVPQECLILTMKANQKYFPLLDGEGRLTNRFLIVSNISPADPSRVIEGNERVVRPRLADAKFFFDKDKKTRLADRAAGLDKVTYHAKLGSMGERVRRVEAIARAIGEELGGPALAAKAELAARLAKADLLTDMVGEFPELQGTMGRYCAQHEGIDEDVAFAIEDHYKPRFAGDELPRNEVGVVLALADKLETLVGLFGIGQVPTGEKDPFALRRHAFGVIRLLAEKALRLDTPGLVDRAVASFGDAATGARAPVLAFLDERTRHYFSVQSGFDEVTEVARRTGQNAVIDAPGGFRTQHVDAVLALRPVLLVEVRPRLLAVAAFAHLPESASLAAANKRVANILKKVEDRVEPRIDPALLQQPAEAALAEALEAVKLQADAAYALGDYAASLQALAALKEPVDAFFDQVMVNVDDEALRANRLGLLATLHAAMNRVADLSRLAA
ncbi:MAG TPA: glycine--tRNA ligase subunit beta [Methylibium sp.]|uniref:glycine--tRNA ligase subunit beta n=1 Tax=Methylibium sp. TaxID=2067992 RepID=UPI002DB7D87A|nr:glycine--tRNA ligase subunit beta [Methylibium sp.]HEU4460910.1 glycine--tRNA ligase subunit beta [Methylibium sp.]